MKLTPAIWTLMILATLLVPALAAEADGGAAHAVGWTFLWIAVILIAAKLSSLVERFGQPAVLGELVIGIVIGNLALFGLGFFEAIKADPLITFLAELGVVILLFQIGLESNIAQMKKVGARAFLVAIIGVVLPFAIGYFLGPYFLPGLSSNAYLFLGATLTATSVGITARVFKDLGKLKTPEAQIVLGAAVIDDVLGLVILAVVSAIVTAGSVGLGTVSWILAKALLFLVGAIIVGNLAAPRLGRWLSKVHTGHGMKIALAIAFCLVFAFLAQEIGLAPIVGAFAAGLVLDPVHFRYFREPEIVSDLRKHLKSHPEREHMEKALEEHAEKHVEHLVEPIALFLVPIFFVLTGVMVDLTTLFDVKVLLVALGLTAVAVAGKVLAGFAAGPVRKWVVGFGMVPRGEVGLIFATIGRGLGVVNDQVFSVIVIVVILTTLMTPPILGHMLRKAS